ncbi:hypothetical protein ABPG72_016025 [Tetrahymena utriculariae]
MITFSWNVLQLILVSIIILVTSSLIQQYQDDLLQKFNDSIPNLIQEAVSSSQGKANQLETISKLISSYKQILENSFGKTDEYYYQVRKNQNLAFGYVADLDIYVDALELMKQLGFNQFQQPKFHDSLLNKQEVGETFSYYFEKGAGSELFVQNKELFKEIVDISKRILKKDGLGGNASTMAARAFKEGTKVILGHAMNKKFYKEIFQEKAILVEELSEIKDIHLVLDYYKDETWGGKATPRSNRMYLNHDIENSQLSYMDRLHDFIRKTPNLSLDILGLGGFQLLNHRNATEISHLMKKLGKELLEMRMYGPKIHMEMGTFTDDHLLSELIRHPLLQTDSIGLNEQELKNLIQYLENQHFIEAVSSEFELNQALNDVLKLISLFHKYKFKINRVHYHTINLQMICSNVNEWESSRLALVKSITVALQESENKERSFFDFESQKLKISIPEQIILPFFDDTFNIISSDSEKKSIEFNPEDPVSCWNPHKSIECCVAPNIQVIHPQKTCGLGDNISSTGLVYHKVISNK